MKLRHLILLGLLASLAPSAASAAGGSSITPAAGTNGSVQIRGTSGRLEYDSGFRYDKASKTLYVNDVAVGSGGGSTGMVSLSTGVISVLAIVNGGTGGITAGEARTNLGLVIDSDVQAYDADLTDLADGSLTGSKIGSGVPAANIAAGSLGASVIASSLTVSAYSNSVTIRSNLGLAIGSDVQAYDADLDDLADGSLTGSKIGSGVPAANVAAGSLGGSVICSSITTAAYSSSNQIRTNLGLAIGTDVQAYDADLDDLADGSLTGSKVGSGVPAANIAAGGLGTSVIASSVAASAVGTNQIAASAVTAAKMANADHGDVSWSGGVATVDNVAAANVAAGTLGASVMASSVSAAAFYNSPTLRTNLGLAIGTNVQAYDADLDDLADGSLTGTKVGSGVPAANIAAGSLGSSVIASSIATSGVTAGSYGTAANVSSVTIGADGRVTSAANVPIAITGSAVSGGTFGAVNGSALTSLTAANISAGTLGAAVIASSVAASAVGTNQIANSTITAAKMATADHGDVSWSGGVATVDNVAAANVAAGTLGASVIASSVSATAVRTAVTAGSNITLTPTANGVQVSAAGGSLTLATGTSSGWTSAATTAGTAIVFDSQYFGVVRTAATTGFFTLTDIPATTVSADKMDLSASPDSSVEEYLVAWSSVTNRGRPFTPITTFYFEQSRESPRFVFSATNNPFWVAASTDPYYGLMKFSNSVSSESNCGYFPMPTVRDYNTSIDLRLDEFRILVGTGTDSAAQRYMVAVATKTNTNWLNANWTNTINVDMASSLGTVSGTERALASATTLTSWNTLIASGVPWAVRVCRDGDDGTNDASTVDSFFSMLTIRAGNTNP